MKQSSYCSFTSITVAYLKKIKYFDSFDYLIIFWLICLRSFKTEKGKPSIEKSNNQIWFFWFFDSFDFEKKFLQTDRPTDRQTDRVTYRDTPCLKNTLPALNWLCSSWTVQVYSCPQWMLNWSLASSLHVCKTSLFSIQLYLPICLSI